MPSSNFLQVRCSIKNCHYWQEGNECGASEILITSDDKARTLPDTIDATMAVQVGESPVSDCTQSCCKTFSPKGSHYAYLDGVHR